MAKVEEFNKFDFFNAFSRTVIHSSRKLLTILLLIFLDGTVMMIIVARVVRWNKASFTAYNLVITGFAVKASLEA